MDTESSIPRDEEGVDIYTGAWHKERGGSPRDTEGNIPRGE